MFIIESTMLRVPAFGSAHHSSRHTARQRLDPYQTSHSTDSSASPPRRQRTRHQASSSRLGRTVPLHSLQLQPSEPVPDSSPNLLSWDDYLGRAPVQKACINAIHQALLLDQQVEHLWVRHQRAIQRGQEVRAAHLGDQIKIVTSLLFIYLKLASKTAYSISWMDTPSPWVLLYIFHNLWSFSGPPNPPERVNHQSCISVISVLCFSTFAIIKIWHSMLIFIIK